MIDSLPRRSASRPGADVARELPGSSAVLAAFRTLPAHPGSNAFLFEAANALVTLHRRALLSGGGAVSARLDGERAALIRRIDAWAGGRSTELRESLGGMVDRLAELWLVALASPGAAQSEAREALWQLADLADTYDNVVLGRPRRRTR